MTSEQVIAVQRKFYRMAGMNGELCQEGLDRLASGFGRYGYESHRECSDEEWRRETREELHDAFIMLTGLEQSRTHRSAATRPARSSLGEPEAGSPGAGDPLGMVVGVVLKHLEDGFSATLVEDMMRTLGELAAQDGREMMELAFRLGRPSVDANVPEHAPAAAFVDEPAPRARRSRPGTMPPLMVEDVLVGQGVMPSEEVKGDECSTEHGVAGVRRGDAGSGSAGEAGEVGEPGGGA